LIRLSAASPHHAAFHFAWFRAFHSYPAAIGHLNGYGAFTTISQKVQLSQLALAMLPAVLRYPHCNLLAKQYCPLSIFFFAWMQLISG
jgi:hypothetical protein